MTQHPAQKPKGPVFLLMMALNTINLFVVALWLRHGGDPLAALAYAVIGLLFV